MIDGGRARLPGPGPADHDLRLEYLADSSGWVLAGLGKSKVSLDTLVFDEDRHRLARIVDDRRNLVCGY
jgi:hypothetical protein